MNRYSLKSFTILWMMVFIASFMGFIYIILNLFFSEHITASSLKDLKYGAYVAKINLSEERERMENSVALHVTSPEFIDFLKTKDWEKASRLIQNWKDLLSLDEVSFYNNDGVKFDLQTGEPSEDNVKISPENKKKLDFGYEQVWYKAGEEELTLSVERKIVDSAYNPIGYLIEAKSIPYTQIVSEPGLELIVTSSDGVQFTSSGILDSERLSPRDLAMGAEAFELQLSGKQFDVFRLDVAPRLTFFIAKTNLRSKVFKKFYQKYLVYFVLFLIFLILFFYLSYYLQVFKPLGLISDFIVKGGSSDKIDAETSVKEISLIAQKIEERIQNLSGDVERTKKDRAEDMTRLVASVAHELNNSLSYLGGNLDYLKTELDGEEIDQEDFKEAITSAQLGYERIKKIVSDLKVFSSKRDLKLEWISVPKFEEMLKDEFPDLQTSLAPEVEDLEAYVDPARAYQILKNLIVNAKQAYKDNQNTKLLCSMYKADTGIAIEVRDWAGGIPQSVQNKVFEPFYTTKKNTGGAGLGLALSRSLAEEMQSELYLKQTNSEGSVFCFTMRQFRRKV